MTITFPDISHYQAGLNLIGAPAVIAKATEGTGYIDPSYLTFKAQATAMAVPFLAYHYLHHGDIHDQVVHAESVVGVGQPLMLDVEIVIIDNVRLPDPTLTDVVDFMTMWAGPVSVVYLPHWFWQGVWHSPDLGLIAQHGAQLISSEYTAYSDTGPGWAPYGGMAPVIWQYTSSQAFNGRRVDFNAYKGTVAQLRKVFEGDTMSADDVIVGESQLYDQAANRNTATGRNFANDFYKIVRDADGFDSATGETLNGRLDTIETTLARLEAAVAAIPGATLVAHTHDTGATGTVTTSGHTGPAIPT